MESAIFSPSTTYLRGAGVGADLVMGNAEAFLQNISDNTIKVSVDRIMPTADAIRLENGHLMLGDYGVTKEGALMLCPSAMAMARRAEHPEAYVDAFRFAQKYGLLPEARAVIDARPDARPKIEAFQRDSYGELKNIDAYQQVVGNLGRVDMGLRRIQVTGRKLLLDFQQRENHKEVAVGDVVGSGISCLNSEDGTVAFRVNAMLLRLRCSNGMVMPQSFFDCRAIHRRNILTTIHTKLKQAGNIDLSGVIDMVRDSVSKVWESARHNPLFAEAYGIADPRPMLEQKGVRTVFEGWNLINDFQSMRGASVETRRQREANSFNFLNAAMQ